MRGSKLLAAVVAILVLALAAVCLAVVVTTAPAAQPPAAQSTDPPTSEPTEPPTESVFTVPTVPESQAVQTIRAFAEAHDLTIADYPASLIRLLERNPETEDFVLHYPLEHTNKPSVDLSEYDSYSTVPLFLQWDRRWGYMEYGNDVAGINGCGPLCLSMVAYHLTHDPQMSPDKIITFAIRRNYCSYTDGSYWTLISSGAKELGLSVAEISPDKERVIANLEVGNPIICVVGPGDFTTTGHFIVLTGVKDGLIQVNDPNSRANSEKLWDFDRIRDQIQVIWALWYDG